MGLDHDEPAGLTRLPQVTQLPRATMGADGVIALIEAATTIGPIAGPVLGVAAAAGARRADLAALRWRDRNGSVPAIDSAVTAVRSEDGPVSVDSRTKTAERHSVSFDWDTVEPRKRLRVVYEDVGPSVGDIGDAPPNPDRVGRWWWAREVSGIDTRSCRRTEVPRAGTG